MGKERKSLDRNYIDNTIEFWSDIFNNFITVNTVGIIPQFRPFVSTKSSSTKKVVYLGFSLDSLPPYVLHVYDKNKELVYKLDPLSV